MVMIKYQYNQLINFDLNDINNINSDGSRIVNSFKPNQISSY